LASLLERESNLNLVISFLIHMYFLFAFFIFLHNFYFFYFIFYIPNFVSFCSCCLISFSNYCSGHIIKRERGCFLKAPNINVFGASNCLVCLIFLLIETKCLNYFSSHIPFDSFSCEYGFSVATPQIN